MSLMLKFKQFLKNEKHEMYIGSQDFFNLNSNKSFLS